MYAHYFTKQLIISQSTNPSITDKTIKVSGKREAKQLAKKLNATPWNF